jgi:predicted nucleic acid-binding Zn ribbon protein
VGVDPPVDPLYFQKASACGQDQVREHSDCDHRHGRRRCLLKGCEGWFEPARPQCRYCSDACRRAARRWSRWRAALKYRASESGKNRRRAQCQRYRERQRMCKAERVAAGRIAAEAECEGQRCQQFSEDSEKTPCDRPGCYDQFAPTPHDPPQRFCSAACREALRRVKERERRLRQRRRRGCCRR